MKTPSQNKPHKHAELIKAWADGAEIEYQTLDGSWAPISEMSWDEENNYRIKPEKEYPKSTLSKTELVDILSQYMNSVIPSDISTAKAVADAAVKKYIKENEE